MIVVDTNVLAYLYIPGARSDLAADLLRHDSIWCAPLLWRSEFRNVLALYLRRGVLSFSAANIVIREAEERLAGREYQADSLSVLELVRDSDCSAYDCEFVALAKHLGTRLHTMDARVLRAFPDIAVPLGTV